MTLTAEMKKWVLDNPEEADNKEDLLNWACDKFDIEDAEEICDFIYKNVDLPS